MPMTKPGKFDSKGAWDGFRGEIWQEEINVRDFIQKNYTPYDGDESFLAGPTERTEKLWNHVQKLQKEEREKGGVLECETEVVSGLTAYGPGYISEDLKDMEQIVGLQTGRHQEGIRQQTPYFHRECRGSCLRGEEDGRDRSLLPDGPLWLYEADRQKCL